MNEQECCRKNIFQKVSESFVDSVGKIAKDPTKASEETIEERLRICQSCDRLNKSLGICRECGCIVKLKTRFQSVNCPLEKW